MPSATTADSKDSMAPSIAMANAGPISSMQRVRVISGQVREGRPRGISPKVLPMVATLSKLKTACMLVTTISAASGPGTRAKCGMREVKMTSNKETTASTVVVGTNCGNTCRKEEHKSELQSLMRISYDGFYLTKKN